MKINEILRISSQEFPIRNVKQLLSMTKDGYGFIKNFTVNYLEQEDERVIILTDENKNIAAYVGFISRMNGKVWQVKNLQTYAPYKGQHLGAEIFAWVKREFKKSIQSDIEQSPGAEILWTKTLPELGFDPKIFDCETQYILDKSNPKAYENALDKMYKTDDNDSEKYRYTWILEKNDCYSSHNILKENQLLLPYIGFWYTFEDERK